MQAQLNGKKTLQGWGGEHVSEGTGHLFDGIGSSMATNDKALTACMQNRALSHIIPSLVLGVPAQEETCLQPKKFGFLRACTIGQRPNTPMPAVGIGQVWSFKRRHATCVGSSKMGLELLW